MTSLDLDHVGIAVRDLDAAARRFERLGFQLTPRGYHTLPANADGMRPRAGTANYCVMLKRGYIELIGIVDPDYVGRLWEALDRYEGLHIVAFGTPDAKAAAADLRRAGLPAADMRPLERPLVKDGIEALARFEIVDFPDDIVPEIYSFAIHHTTPDLLWQPKLLAHANGVVSLEEIAIVVEEAADFAARLSRLVGIKAEGTDELTLPLAAGAVRIVGRQWLDRNVSGAPFNLPWVAVMTLGVSDIEATAALLQRNGVTFEKGDARLVVSASEACGVEIAFVRRGADQPR
jgi:catechol 2,3-dioxygenase-like lactoylglutathione lyase family enzyme